MSVRFSITTSLDGFLAGPEPSLEELYTDVLVDTTS